MSNPIQTDQFSDGIILISGWFLLCHHSLLWKDRSFFAFYISAFHSGKSCLAFLRHRCQKFHHLCVPGLNQAIRSVWTISIVRNTHQTPDSLSLHSHSPRYDVQRQAEECWKEHHWIPRRDRSRTLERRLGPELDQRSQE
jgi:hypothetical protein